MTTDAPAKGGETRLRAGRLAKLFDDGGEALSVYWDEAREYTQGRIVVRQYDSDQSEFRLTLDDAEWLVENLVRALHLHPTGGNNGE